jgi:hypothetical protein
MWRSSYYTGGLSAAASPLSIGAHTVVNNVQASGTWPMVTSPVTTQVSGSSIVLFVGALDSSSPPGTDSKGNTYTQIGSWQSYASGQGFLSAWIKKNAAGGSGHTFNITNGTTTSTGPEATLFAIEVIGGTDLDTFSFANPTVNPIPATALTPGRTGTMLLMCAFGDSFGVGDTYTPSSPYSLIDQQTNGGTSMAAGVASRLSPSTASLGGSMTSAQTPSSGAQSGIWLVSIK